MATVGILLIMNAKRAEHASNRHLIWQHRHNPFDRGLRLILCSIHH